MVKTKSSWWRAHQDPGVNLVVFGVALSDLFGGVRGGLGEDNVRSYGDDAQKRRHL